MGKKRPTRRDAAGTAISHELFEEACEVLHDELRRRELVPPSGDMPYPAASTEWRNIVSDVLVSTLGHLAVGVVDEDELFAPKDRVG